MAKLRLGFLASGRGSNLQAILDNIQNGSVNAEAVVVISDKEDAYALERAKNHGIPALHVNPKSYSDKVEYEKAILEILRQHDVELVVLAGYMRLIGPNLIREYANKIMNIHPALLPAFPGTHGQRDALEYGVKFAGCTVHFVDEGMDSGPIILQAVVPVCQDDDVDTLSARILEQEHKIYSQAIQLYAEHKLKIDGRRVKIVENE